MPRDASKLTCGEFQGQLPELINSDANLEDNPHVKACLTCRRLVQELEGIRAEARKLFPSEWSEVTWWPR